MTKRKFNPDWPSAQSDTPAARRERKRQQRQREKERQARLDVLLAPLGERDGSAFLVSPMFIGGDTTDLETFLLEHYTGSPVTPATMRQVAQQFREWYRQTAPGEYHDPMPLPWMDDV